MAFEASRKKRNDKVDTNWQAVASYCGFVITSEFTNPCLDDKSVCVEFSPVTIDVAAYVCNHILDNQSDLLPP